MATEKRAFVNLYADPKEMEAPQYSEIEILI